MTNKKRKTSRVLIISIFIALIANLLLLKELQKRSGWISIRNKFGLENISEKITPKQLKKILDTDILLINVHTPYEGEIRNTDLFIEYDSIKANQTRLPDDKNTKIILYCKTGRMSSQALATLKSLGYKNVRHLEGGMNAWEKAGFDILDLSKIPSQVLPEEGFELPISWEDIAPRLIRLGVIDKEKFEKVVTMGKEEKSVFEGLRDTPVRINSQNSQFVVDLLWALGLAQKSLVYEKGPMGKEYKDKAQNFASTGGWTLSVGNAMNYYNKFDLLGLTTEEQERVFEISKNIYRPCCGNPTSFPDCNHGMAALAAVELMVKKGLPDDEIYKNILKLNSFWFPSNYLTVATYFGRQGIVWDKVDAREVLGKDYSSGQGVSNVAKKVGPLPFDTKFGGSCGA
jgi:rhodanese-related sulfurtransferase